MNAPHRFGHVALVGLPNAGKSTLLNTILGQKLSAVSAKPQTTRTHITGILTDPDAQVVFIDTPGLTKAGGALSRFMLGSVRQALSEADRVAAIVDAKAMAKEAREETRFEHLLQTIRQSGTPTTFVLNKIDALADRAMVLPLIERLTKAVPGAEFFPISALTGLGVPELLAHLKAALPEGEAAWPEDQLSTAPMRFLAAEIIREKLFVKLRQELPYHAAVTVDDWREENGRPRILATIHVSKDAHKGIVIGKGGQMLKEIGSQARAEIGELVGGSVHLEILVKVSPGWMDKPSFLRELTP